MEIKSIKRLEDMKKRQDVFFTNERETERKSILLGLEDVRKIFRSFRLKRNLGKLENRLYDLLKQSEKFR